MNRLFVPDLELPLRMQIHASLLVPFVVNWHAGTIPEVVDDLWYFGCIAVRRIVVVIIQLFQSAESKCGVGVLLQDVVPRHTGL